EINRRYTSDQTLAQKAEADLLTESNLRNNLERRRALFNTVVDQLKQAQFVGDYSGIRAQTIEPPNAPRAPVAPRPVLVLLLALAAGLLIGFGAALLAH